MLRILDLSVGYAMLFSRRWMFFCRQRNASTAYLNCMMKLTKPKGSNHASQAGFCCLCQWPDETHFGQRQQTRLGSGILLPLPQTRWNSPGSKAAILSRKQDFAASAVDPMKLALVKGSNSALEARFCCHCRRPDETRRDQRQQSRLGSRIQCSMCWYIAVFTYIMYN